MKSVSNGKKLISHHNFMFAFRFDKIKTCFNDRHQYYKEHTFDERVVLDTKFASDMRESGWIYEKFKVNSHLDYNEMVYFYDFVKDSLFNTQDFDKNATSYYFSKKLKNNSKYIINISKTPYREAKRYELEITSIILRVFDTGVAILSFELENYQYKELQDILNINEFGRRLYPEFLGEEFSIQDTKKAFLADSIEVCGIKDNFINSYYSSEIKLARYILEILGESFTTTKSQEGRYLIQPILDDRMYVMCWYGSDCFSNQLKNSYQDNYYHNKERNRDFDKWYDAWYKFVYLDAGDKMVQDESMESELLKKASYTRWKGYGTFYGITRYSFVCLTNQEYFGTQIISKHMQSIYFQMMTLILAQRASILRFSDEITAISDIDNEREIPQKISNLYKNYLRFKNKLYFKEVTPQEQGIELYDKAREIMRIDSDIQDLSVEIGLLNNYAFVLEEKEEKEQMNKLTKLGTIFLPGTFIAGIFGMNVFPDDLINNLLSLLVVSGVIVGLTVYISKINDISIKEFFTKEKK